MTTQDQQNSRFQPLVLESEHRAKMTYSIPDLVSRNRTKNQEFFQVLESTSPRNQIKTYRDANPEFGKSLATYLNLAHVTFLNLAHVPGSLNLAIDLQSARAFASSATLCQTDAYA